LIYRMVSKVPSYSLTAVRKYKRAVQRLMRTQSSSPYVRPSLCPLRQIGTYLPGITSSGGTVRINTTSPSTSNISRVGGIMRLSEAVTGVGKRVRRCQAQNSRSSQNATNAQKTSKAVIFKRDGLLKMRLSRMGSSVGELRRLR